MRSLLSGVLLACLIAGALLAQGPLTPLMQLRGRTDAAGSLYTIGAAASGAQGPLTPLSNLRGRTDASGSLYVTLAGGAATPASVSITQGTLTADAQALSSTATWNNAGVTFTHWKANVTDTASASGSLLLDLQVGGVSQFTVRKNGNIVAASEITAGSLIYPTTNSRSAISAPANGHFTLANNAASAGIGLDVATDGTLKIRDRAQAADGALTASTVRASTALGGSGTGVSVANVGANSCGTTAATIAGNQTSGVITIGATGGTQCRVTFTTAAPVARDCVSTDSTTTIATRATAVSTTTHDFLGAFVAGDLVTYVCLVR